jgi:glyoxylate/hydroxypyruvate reductase A
VAARLEAQDIRYGDPRPADLLCTTHIAATPRAKVAAAQFLDNLRRSRAGLPLVNVVDRRRGY